MQNKYIIYLAILGAALYGSSASAQVKRSVSTTRTVVDGKVTEERTVYDTSAKRDTVTKKVRSKVVFSEVPCAANGTVYINNEYRKINILPATGNTLRMETVAYYTGDVKLSDEVWLEKLNIKMQGGNRLINITSGGVTTNGRESYTAYQSYGIASVSSSSGGGTVTSSGSPATPAYPDPPAAQTYSYSSSGSGDIGITSTGNGRLTTITKNSSSGNSIAVYDEDGTMRSMNLGVERVLTIYVPRAADLHISSKYANVIVGFNAVAIDVKITNASLDMQDAETAKIECTYGNIKAGTIKDAVISLTSGKLYVKDLQNADLNTKYSQAEAENCNTLKIRSVSDDYDVDEVKIFSGVKDYGSMKLGKLTGSLQLSGVSSDLRIKKIDPDVSEVTIDNKYADLRLPVSDLKNYNIHFTGNYSNIYAPFSINVVSSAAPEVKNSTAGTGQTMMVISNNTKSSNKEFNVAQGDIKGKHTSFSIKCLSCSLDFK